MPHTSSLVGERCPAAAYTENLGNAQYPPCLSRKFVQIFVERDENMQARVARFRHKPVLEMFMLILRYAACFAAYWLVMVLSHRSRLWFRLLPYAGVYAYNDSYREYVQWHKHTGGMVNVRN